MVRDELPRTYLLYSPPMGVFPAMPTIKVVGAPVLTRTIYNPTAAHFSAVVMVALRGS